MTLEAMVWPAVLVLVACMCLCKWRDAAQRTPVVLAPDKPRLSSSGQLAKTPNSTQLRLLSLNACILVKGAGFAATGDDRKEERLRDFVDMLKDYDIVLLQEVWGCWWWELTSFYEACRQAGWYVVYSRVGLFMNCGNVILSRFPVVASSAMPFKSTEGWQRLLSNGVLHASANVQGKTVHLFTTHLQSETVPYESSLNQNSRAIRGGQLREMKRFVDKTVTDEDEWFVCGDFNIEGGADSEEYTLLCTTWGQPSVLEALGFPASYNDKSFLAPIGWRNLDYNACLDHVFTSLSQPVAQVLTEPDISDHFPVVISCGMPVIPSDVSEEPRHRNSSRLRHR